MWPKASPGDAILLAELLRRHAHGEAGQRVRQARPQRVLELRALQPGGAVGHDRIA